MSNIYSFISAPDSILSSVGGKGASLIKLTRLKLPVPEGYVIGTDATSEEISSLVNSLSAKYTYAVRSSAINEDGAGASFAGQYETITDVKSEDVLEAIKAVQSSSQSNRVQEYSDSMGFDSCDIGVVVHRFVKPDYAGVIFTSDVITGSSRYIVGNYVRGEGEDLVSGSKNAMEFRMDAIKYSYEGPSEFSSFAKKLYKYCSIIRDSYKCPMDIEWAVSEGKVFILQARPITTINRGNEETFDINGSLDGEYLLTKTNVGEIFMKPVSPMTYSALNKINEFVGMPYALDFINGQAYMNISVLCSMQIALGVSEEKAFSNIRDLVGKLPEGVKVPVFPFDGKAFKKHLFKLLFNKNKSKLSRNEKSEMVRNLAVIARSMIDDIRMINDNASLLSYWEQVIIPRLNDGLSSVLAECGLQMVPLFSTRNKLTKIAGEDLANRLCGSSVGILESMKPILMIEDIINGKVTSSEYMDVCGQRCVNEMELSEKHPYEIPGFVDSAIEDYKSSGVSMYSMVKQREEEYAAAVSEFKSQYPSKAKWLDKEMTKFIGANKFREEIRSKGVWIFCVLREFLLSVGRINNIGDDIFLLYIDEAFSLIKGDKSVLRYIDTRRNNVIKNESYDSFPGLIYGRFDPDEYMKSSDKRRDFYCSSIMNVNLSSDVKGFPGAVGKIEGIARVITDISHIDELQNGEILVTSATNIGWTVAFHKVSAIVTDIGAPLSHAAIVAREFGIPAVVGSGNATTVIKTGDRIIVDGGSGIVQIVK